MSTAYVAVARIFDIPDEALAGGGGDGDGHGGGGF